ncbi:MAG TPA: hypothetical protein VN281_10685, partial [Verrucomicrobiae bacterium]|nr:hypothetical protein [Verrucomicrobiae bacterium]
MSLRRIVPPIIVLWIAIVSVLHLTMNLHVHFFAAKQATQEEKFRVGFIPVTCHLTCPVTDFINRSMTGKN